MRRVQLRDTDTVVVVDDKAVMAFLAPHQPSYREKNARDRRIWRGGWFWNQGERSQLLVRNGYIVGRVDCLPSRKPLTGKMGV